MRQVKVTRADGRTAVFAVDDIAGLAKTNFPTKRVYAPTPRPTLRLITCGGPYDELRNRYLHNVVAFAHLVGTRPAAPA